MTSPEQRAAALANQRAAAFVRFGLLNDHEAMHVLLTEVDEDGRLGFVTALGSIAGAVATQALGRDGALAYLQTVAQTSAVLAQRD